MSTFLPDWMSAFPQLAAMSKGVLAQLARVDMLRVPAGTVLFRDGDACRGYVFVISGSIRVQKMDPDGHEIVLYRVEDGQTCMLTTSCLLGARSYPAEGIAEAETQLAMIPAGEFDKMLADAGFRRFVLAMISERIADLMMLIEDVAFGRMDRRLARRLLSLAQQQPQLQLTHQQLASELGTAREVVSRILKDMERRQLIELRRGRILLRQPEALQRIADGMD